MSDFSIVIPHRGDGIGLWATIHSCEDDLKYSTKRYNYNYVIVSNGELTMDSKQTLESLKKSGRLLKHIHSDQPVTPPKARSLGADAADGDVLFFFDNHCLVSRAYFDRALLDFKDYNMDMLHSTTVFYEGQPPQYQYKLRLRYNFWGETDGAFPRDYKPYRIGVAGHGGFAVRKDVWHEVGAYGPDDLFQGYGGEEMLFDLKMGRMGKNNWIDSRMVHYHYNGNRGYSRHFTNEYYINLLVSALVIGGKKWFDIIFESFVTGTHLQIKKKCPLPMYDLGEIAWNRGIEYSKYLDSVCQYSLDELLLKWNREGVVY
jgi:Glycosyl transferase family 2